MTRKAAVPSVIARADHDAIVSELREQLARERGRVDTLLNDYTRLAADAMKLKRKGFESPPEPKKPTAPRSVEDVAVQRAEERAFADAATADLMAKGVEASAAEREAHRLALQELPLERPLRLRLAARLGVDGHLSDGTLQPRQVVDGGHAQAAHGDRLEVLRSPDHAGAGRVAHIVAQDRH